MRILFLTHAFNSLTQRLFVELREAGHEVSVEFDINETTTLQAVELFQPDLIIAPFLKRAIPEAIWSRHVCLIVHPGVRGDRGPSALDWAILDCEQHWGVTVLQANAEMDAGDVWAFDEFAMRDATKSSLYRNEVTETAVAAVKRAVARYASGEYRPEPLDDAAGVRGEWHPAMQQSDRAIDWQSDDTATVLRKIRSADGFPGVRDTLFGREVFLYDAHPEATLRGAAGGVLARCGSALCRATRDGAVWIGHLRDRQSAYPFKLPATRLLAEEVRGLPEIVPDRDSGYHDIWYGEAGKVGYLHFPFYNGAMGTQQCERLRQAYRDACRRDTRVIVLMGGPDFWSNGMHLNLIEAADSAANESWRNINAIDDLAEEIITTTSHLTVAALRGNAGAGGVFLARAADYVWAHAGVILNPHYKDMGNLYGSEYWTYLLPRYAGDAHAAQITRARLPMGVREACAMGLVDDWFGSHREDFERQLVNRANALAASSDYVAQLEEKRARRRRDESNKPLARYRDEELAKMRLNFYGFDPSYHVARYNFVYKVSKSRTPLTIARHRRTGFAGTVRNVS
jgi:putative two-component system hydrogenase maturation factor HypX/HoxX